MMNMMIILMFYHAWLCITLMFVYAILEDPPAI